MQLSVFNHAAELDAYFADEIATLLSDAITQRGEAYLAVSGGKTPIGFFKALSQKALPWEHVTITLTDERCVETSSKESNEYLVKSHLLQNQAQKAKFVGLWNGDSSPVPRCHDSSSVFMDPADKPWNVGIDKSQDVEVDKLYDVESERNYQHVLKFDLDNCEKKIAALPRFDAVILGMGTDGHTASLFPCSEELSIGLEDKKAMLLVQPKTAPYLRLSLTKARLLKCQMIFLHLLGDEKLKTLHKAIEGSDPLIMPIRAFLQQSSVEIFVRFASE